MTLQPSSYKKPNHWPLASVRVLVTRPAGKASRLSELLRREGAVPVEVPTIEIAPLEDFRELDSRLLRIASYDWIVFGSVNAVEAVLACLTPLGVDVRGLLKVRVAAVGPSTARALEDAGVTPYMVPASYRSESLVAGFKGKEVTGRRFLVLSADIGGRILQGGLSSLGAKVDTVAAYRNVLPTGAGRQIREALEGGLDIVTFASSSAARNLVSLLDEESRRILDGSLIACIGPVTASTAEEAGLEVGVVAREHTLEGLVDALRQYHIEEGCPDG